MKHLGIVAPFVIGAALMVGLTAAMKVSTGASSEQRALTVYPSQAECVADRGNQQLCAELEINARFQAERLIWPFEGLQACTSLYGEQQCLVADDGRVRLAMSGFTQFGVQDDNAHAALPVFRSDVYRAHYLPNAYPVVMGSNTIMTELVGQGTFIAGRPRSLGESLCVDGSCMAVVDHLATLQLPRSVATALFAN
jgi:uncharacterized protein YgiB involved in biofilm formation